jgi:hypothetical protein
VGRRRYRDSNIIVVVQIDYQCWAMSTDPFQNLFFADICKQTSVNSNSTKNTIHLPDDIGRILILWERSMLTTFLSMPYVSTILLTNSLAAILAAQFLGEGQLKIIAVLGVDG